MKITVTNGDAEIIYEENQESTNFLKVTNPDYNTLVLEIIKSITEQVIILNKIES